MFDIPAAQFRDLIYSNRLVWAPDGDEAFDDGSHVLHFDIADRVRLIVFKSGKGYLHDPTTRRDVWMEAKAFYEVLVDWRDLFGREWESLPRKFYERFFVIPN